MGTLDFLIFQMFSESNIYWGDTIDSDIFRKNYPKDLI